MSRETAQWLNQNVLIGHTDRRGTAWHYRASEQGAEPNHYPGAIPVVDVHRRLFDWSAVRGTSKVTWITDDGVTTAEDTQHFPVGRPDTGHVFGYFADGYQIHQYQDWLVEKVEATLDSGLSVGSAGLLKGGAQAWVSIEVPDTVTTPEGIPFRPHLIACTSHDGSLATTYKRSVINVVCDNTLSAALTGTGQVLKFKHSRSSAFRALQAREALDLIQLLSDEFAAQVRELSRTPVSDRMWNEFLAAHVEEKPDSKRSRTLANNKRDALRTLWNDDERVAPWRGTAWGVLQATNTYEHHLATVRNTTRVERNMTRAITGQGDALDQKTLDTLDKVLASA